MPNRLLPVLVRWLAVLACSASLHSVPATASAAESAALTPPQLLTAAEAEYPPSLEASGLSAAVEVELTVATDGSARDPRVVQSAGPEFDAAALAAVPLLRFAPAWQAGKPVAVRIRYRFAFAPPVLRRAPVAASGRYERRAVDTRPSGAVAIRGRLLERGTGRPIAFETLLLDGGPQDATTAEDGSFAFAAVTPGKHRIQLPGGEYRATSAQVVVLAGKVAEVTLRAESVRYGLYRASAEAPPRAGDSTRRSLSAAEIQRVPGTQGDAFKVVQNLPGVARPGGLGSDIIVRGSAPGDTWVALEGVRIPLLYHFGGIYSVLNTDFLDGIDFFPGGYSSYWGRAVGGVLNARLRTPKQDQRLSGYVETNVFHTGVFLQGSLGKDTQFAVAARRSYIDWVLKAVVPDLPFTVAPRYWDWQASLDHKFSPRTSLTLFGFGSSDKLSFVNDQPAGTDTRAVGGLRFGVDFHGAFAVLRHTAKTWQSRTTVGGIWGLTGAQFGSLLRFDATSLDLTLRHDVEVGRGPVRLRGGLDLLHTPFWADIYAPGGQLAQEGSGRSNNASSGQYFNYSGSFAFVGPGAWWDAVIDLSPRLQLVPGMRVDFYRGVDSDQTLLPRLSLRWQQTDELAWKLASGFYSQRPQPQEVLSFGGLGNPNLKSVRGWDVSAGATWQPTLADSVDAQLFWKSLWNVATIAQGFFPTVPYTNDGAGRVYGLELLARHKASGTGWFGWLAWTLLWAERRDQPASSWRPFDYDQRHILAAVAGWQLPKNWQVSGRFRLVGGNPTTPIVGAVWNEQTDSYDAVEGKYNSARLPTFWQLDLRVDKRVVWDRWIFNFYLDVQNATNRKNTEGTSWNYDYTTSAVQSGLPIIPSLGVRAEF